MKTKYNYLRVIQQNYGQGWEDVSEYEANSTGQVSELSETCRISKLTGRKIPLTILGADIIEYKLMGYPTRVIFRKEKNT